MGRPKKIVPKVVHEDAVVEVIPSVPIVTHTLIYPLTVDYPNEGLNDIARKINQVIERLNA